jgi:hypothetical protein
MADFPHAPLSSRLIRASLVAATMAAYLALVVWLIGWGWSLWLTTGAATFVLGFFVIEFLSKASSARQLFFRLTPVWLNFGTIGAYAASSSLFGFAFEGVDALFIMVAVQLAFDFFFHRKERPKLADPTTRDAVLRFSPPEGQALVIVFRDSRIASDVPLEVKLGERGFSRLFGPGFAALAVPPGASTLRAEFGSPHVSNDGPSQLTMHLAEGDVCGVHAMLTMDMARVYLRLERLPNLGEAKARLSALPLAA